MQNDDCESTFLGKIPTWKIDFSSCKGSCMLRWFWLGLQDSGKRWQVYSTCTPASVSLEPEQTHVCVSDYSSIVPNA